MRDVATLTGKHWQNPARRDVANIIIRERETNVENN